MKKILFLIAIVVAIIVTMSSSVFALDEHFEQIDAKYQENIYEVVTKKMIMVYLMSKINLNKNKKLDNLVNQEIWNIKIQ